MKKMGIPAKAKGLVNSITLPAASSPADMTERMTKSFCDTWTVDAASFGSEAMSGRKWAVERAVWQTMEASMGVMDILRKCCLGLAMVRFAVELVRPSSCDDEGAWGRRMRRIGWRREV